jgi:hypothetical protein
LRCAIRHGSPLLLLAGSLGISGAFRRRRGYVSIAARHFFEAGSGEPGADLIEMSLSDRANDELDAPADVDHIDVGTSCPLTRFGCRGFPSSTLTRIRCGFSDGIRLPQE